VPTGINAGVLISPCGVVRIPVLAFVFEHFVCILNIAVIYADYPIPLYIKPANFAEYGNSTVYIIRKEQ
jgi:hypothetical protein